MTTDLSGKKAVVVGVGPGIGRATTRVLAEAGADVAIVAREGSRLTDIAAEIGEATGRRIEPVPADISSDEGRRDLIASVEGLFGGIDALATIAAAGSGNGWLGEADWDLWRLGFEINVVAAMDLARRAAVSMRARGGGSIVYVSTLATRLHMPGGGAYGATKLAGVTAAKTMAKEFGRDGIRVNVVTPGYVAGERLSAMFERQAEGSDRSAQELADRAAGRSAQGRVVADVEIARGGRLLLSPESAGITGVDLPVTAGADPL